MKQLLLLLISVILIPATSHSDDLPRDWAEPTDGFVWPSSPKEAPIFKPKTLKITDLDKNFREIAAMHLKGPNETTPEYATIAEVDLNGDGKNAIFLKIPHLGGTAGSFYYLFAPKREKYVSVGSMQFVDIKFVEKGGSRWYQIETSNRGGPSDYARILHTFFGSGGYQTTRLEQHDLAAKEMVVRKIPYPVFRGTAVFVDGWIPSYGAQPELGDMFVIDLEHLTSTEMKGSLKFTPLETKDRKRIGEPYIPVGGPFEIVGDSRDKSEFRLISRKEHLPVVIDIVRGDGQNGNEYSIHIRGDTFGERLGYLIVIHATNDKTIH